MRVLIVSGVLFFILVVNANADIRTLKDCQLLNKRNGRAIAKLDSGTTVRWLETIADFVKVEVRETGQTGWIPETALFEIRGKEVLQPAERATAIPVTDPDILRRFERTQDRYFAAGISLLCISLVSAVGVGVWWNEANRTQDVIDEWRDLGLETGELEKTKRRYRKYGNYYMASTIIGALGAFVCIGSSVGGTYEQTLTLHPVVLPSGEYELALAFRF